MRLLLLLGAFGVLTNAAANENEAAATPKYTVWTCPAREGDPNDRLKDCTGEFGEDAVCCVEQKTNPNQGIRYSGECLARGSTCSGGETWGDAGDLTITKLTALTQTNSPWTYRTPSTQHCGIDTVSRMWVDCTKKFNMTSIGCCVQSSKKGDGVYKYEEHYCMEADDDCSGDLKYPDGTVRTLMLFNGAAGGPAQMASLTTLLALIVGVALVA